MNHSESSERTIQGARQDDHQSQPTVVSEDRLAKGTDDLDQQPPTGGPSLKQRKWLLIGAAIAALVIGAGLAWRWRQANTAQTADQPQESRVRLTTLQLSTVDNSSEYVADLESPRSVTLRPQIVGRVSQILARSGDRVAAGTPILQIDPDEQAAAVSGGSAAAEAARAEVENARSTLASLEAERGSNLSDVKFNQREYSRYANLAGQGAVSRQVRDQYINNLQRARASLAAINKRIQAQRATVARVERALGQAQANTRAQQVQLQYFRITAPFDGVVGDIPVKLGDLVDTSTQLATVTQNQSLEVNVSVPSERAAELRVGTPVELLNTQGQRVGTSQVFFISPNVNTETQSVLIKSRFDNSRGQLRADAFVRARVIWARRPGVLVPTTAVSRIAGRTFVFVAQKGQSQAGQAQFTAQQKPVELGQIRGNSYPVLQGLQPGEQIITSGVLNLRNGAVVVPES